MMGFVGGRNDKDRDIVRMEDETEITRVLSIGTNTTNTILLLQAFILYGFPRLFTATSEHIRLFTF